MNTEQYLDLKLDLIFTTCCDAVCTDISKKTRERPYPYMRYCFFHYAKKLTSATLANIGKKCGNRDHATVLHGINEFNNLTGVPEFDVIKNRIGLAVHKIANITNEEMVLTKRDRELKYLYSNKKRLERENLLLKKRIENTKIESEILELFNLLSENDLIEFKENRMKPFIRMRSKQFQK